MSRLQPPLGLVVGEIMYKTKIAPSALTLAVLAVGCGTHERSTVETTVSGMPCSLEERDDGTVTIECPDGSTVTFNPGSDGAPGQDGQEGDNGKKGKPGAEGQNGKDGAPGEAGEPGEDGAPGQDGENGAPGDDGTPGQDGASGQEGAEGEPGTDGTPGGDGQQGEPGQSGDAGPSCSVECVDEQTVRMFCEDGNEVRYQVESCRMPPVNLLSARGLHACRILPVDHRLVCWGSDANGALGNNRVLDTAQERGSLVDTRQLEVGLDTRWRSVEIGRSASCGITSQGAAYCWGSSLALGNGGRSSDVPSPVDVSALPAGTTWSVVSPGSRTTNNFGCGITSQGAAYCWGSDSNGSLGNGPGLTATQIVPSAVDVSALPPATTWSTISVGGDHACGLTSSGVAYCWGSGQVAPAALDISTLPPETTWTAISAGTAHVCALTAEGQAYCWGSDTHGQLGNGALSTTSIPSPVDTSAFPLGVTFVQVSAGDQHSCGVTSDGSAYCWGARALGRVGDGSTVGSASSPVAVDVSQLPLGIAWKALSVGPESSCGLADNGEVYCWGADSMGQLGNGAVLSVPQVRPSLAVRVPIGVLVDHSEFSGVVGQDIPQLPLTVVPLNHSTEQLTVTAISNRASIVPNDHITVTGIGNERLLTLEPIASGVCTISVVITNGEDEYSFRFEYGVSAEPPDPTGVYHHQISDASTALDVGGGYMLLGNDENNSLFLHRQETSGLPIKVWNFTAAEQLGSDELDIEGAARSGDTIVWVTSHGNGRTGGTEARRRVIFATKISGSGKNVELSFAGRYGGGSGKSEEVGSRGLWADLIAWDKANGHGSGADALGFEAATQPGVLPNAPSGFNVEGFEFAADGTTGYLGFRAPTVALGEIQHALLVPVTNLLELVDGIGPQSGQGQFGAPILLDLAGRSIRALRRNANGEYLISAGPPDNATPGVNDTWALYTWAGLGHPAVFNRTLPDVNLLAGGTWESIAVVPTPMQSGGVVRLVTDSGDAILYGTDPTKDLEKGLQKSYSQLFTLQ